ncbi:MAG TPA: hypothetical protein VG797_07840, partial [Phycisphaerales bacterium]|nr:hypothetical protein [Phycisphaerales bacterium]
NRIVPATTEELVSKFGLADEAQLRESVKMRLEHRARIEQQMAMRAQISSHFTDSIKMELPEKLTERQAARNLERTRLNLLYRGFDARQVEEKITEMRSSSAQAAVRELKLFFVLAEAADRLKIQVTEDEVNGRIAQIAMERGMRPEQLRNELIQRGQGGMVVQQVREHKTLDAILAKAKVTDMPVDKFNEMMNKKKEEGVSLA